MSFGRRGRGRKRVSSERGGKRREDGKSRMRKEGRKMIHRQGRKEWGESLSILGWSHVMMQLCRDRDRAEKEGWKKKEGWERKERWEGMKEKEGCLVSSWFVVQKVVGKERIPINTGRKGEDGRQRKNGEKKEKKEEREERKEEWREWEPCNVCVSGTSDEMLMHPFFQVTGFLPSRTRLRQSRRVSMSTMTGLSLSHSLPFPNRLPLHLIFIPSLSLPQSFETFISCMSPNDSTLQLLTSLEMWIQNREKRERDDSFYDPICDWTLFLSLLPFFGSKEERGKKKIEESEGREREERKKLKRVKEERERKETSSASICITET